MAKTLHPAENKKKEHVSVILIMCIIIIIWKSTVPINCLVTSILQNIFLCSAEERNSYKSGTI